MLVAATALVAAERNGECHPQILDVVGVDLLELRKPPALVVAVMEQPVLRLFAHVQRALVGHVGRQDRRERGGREQRTRQSTSESQSLHGSPPVLAVRNGPAQSLFSLWQDRADAKRSSPITESVVRSAIGGQYPVDAWQQRRPRPCGCEQSAERLSAYTTS